MAQIKMSIRDKGGELGIVTLPVDQPIATSGEGSIANYYGTIESAIEAVTLGVVARNYFVINEEADDAFPASNFAQREFGLRLILRGEDSAKVFTVTLPTVDADALTLVAGSDQVVLADAGVMAALVTALETNLAYPYGATTESVTVEEAYIVGRNS